MKNQKLNLFFIALTLACFALSRQAQAVCQEGCDLSNGNTFVGDDAVVNNTTGSANTAVRSDGLFSNTIGGSNTASGKAALYINTTGFYNTAAGWDALTFNATGGSNTATGAGTLYSNNGNFNTAMGFDALFYNYTGDNNTAIDSVALDLNQTGSNNTVLGSGAAGDVSGSNNIALGYVAGANLSTGDNNINIGSPGAAGEANTIRIGTVGTQTTTFIAGIRGVAITGGQAVGVNASGQFGIRASSARFKEEIKLIGKATEPILALWPVTFRCKKEVDPSGAPEFGLIAEEVAKVAPDLVTKDEQGKPFTVRCDDVNAMLLNEFLKEHSKGQELQKTIQRQRTAIAQQRAAFQSAITEQEDEIQALTASVQKSR